MLTKKQIARIPKGSYSNAQIATVFPEQGKQKREVILPVDKYGRIVKNLKDAVFMRIMRLNRRNHKAYAN